MSLSHSPKVVTDGLVFYYDMANSQKSWKGAPTTNVVTNSNMTGGWNLSNFSGSSATLTYETEDGIPHLKITNVVLGTGSPDYPRITDTTFTQTITDGFSVSFEAKGTPGEVIKLALYSTGSTKITLAATLTESWKRYTFNNQTTGFTLNQPYIRFDTTIAGSVRYIRKIQVEQKAFATPFVAGTRSTAQAIVDLTGKSTITSTSPTYNIDGTFSFNGGTERLDISNTIGPITNNFSISAWINSTDIAATQNIVSMNGPYFMRISGSKVRFNVLAGGAWLFQNGTTALSSNTWYNFCMVYNYDNSTWTGYINGVQEFSVAKTGTVSNTTFFGYVGYTPQGGEQSNFLGQISVVQYYNKALSLAEVRQNFNTLRGRYGL